MVRTNKGGSVLRFIIVGVVLVALLAGGVYFVRQQIAGSQPSSPQKTAEEPRQPSKAESTPKPEQKNDSTAKEASRPTPAPESSVSTAATPAALPQTGSVDTPWSLVALGILGGLGVAYVRSRRVVYRPL